MLIVLWLVSLLSGALAQDCSNQLEFGTWACPATGVLPKGGDGNARQWIDAHNKYRCMHNVPALVWEPSVKEAADCMQAHKNGVLEHSDDTRYGGYIHGENLGYSIGGAFTPYHVTTRWYDEVQHCRWGSGCKEGTPGEQIGHFTSMMWRGAASVGCGTGYQEKPTTYCQYRPMKTMDDIERGNASWCYLSNMESNSWSGWVPQQADGFTEERCEREAQACGDRSASGGTSTSGGNVLWDEKEGWIHGGSGDAQIPNSFCPTESAVATEFSPGDTTGGNSTGGNTGTTTNWGSMTPADIRNHIAQIRAASSAVSGASNALTLPLFLLFAWVYRTVLL